MIVDNHIVLQVQRGDDTFTIPLSRRFVDYQGYERCNGMASDFASGCTTFAETAKWMGLTRERVRQIYKKHFAQHLPEPDGIARLRACTISRAIERPLPENLRPIWDKATSLGFDVKKVVRFASTGQVRVSARRLIINGKRCVVRAVSKPIHVSAYSLTKHRRIQPGQVGKTEFVIGVVGGDFIIIPPGAPKNCWIPETPPLHDTHRSRWGSWNAWHLLAS